MPSRVLPAMPDLRDHQAMLADGHVVGDLHQVIDLGAPADDRRAQRAAIDGHVGADLHVVADDHVADLRHFAVHAAVLHVAEAIRADHRAGVDAHAVADLGARHRA